MNNILYEYTIPTFSDIAFGAVGYKVSPLVNISNILEIAIQLLPIDEAELLDQLRALMEKTQT